MFIGFVDHESMEIYTKIVFLTGLEAKILSKHNFTIVARGHFFLTSKQNSSRMPSWHPPDSDSGMVQDDESTIKVHNNANACFFRIPLHGMYPCGCNNNAMFSGRDMFTFPTVVVCRPCKSEQGKALTVHAKLQIWQPC